jgi:hypothetical protein
MTEIPWFWPGTALTLVIGLAFGDRVARALRTRPVIGIGLLVATGIIVSATLTPGREALESGAIGAGSCDVTRIGLASLTDLIAFKETTLNVLLFVPLGVAISLLPSSRWKALLAVGAAASPLAIELVQMLVPSFDRACESADVVDNLAGLGLGLALGALAGRQVTIGG